MVSANVPFSMKTTIKKPFSEAIEAVKNAFKKEGFGIISEINVQSTLESKIGADIKPYIIFGMCNPNFAYKALLEEQDIGILMPCNVAVYEENEYSVIVAQDPGALIEMTGKHNLMDLAQEATIHFKRAMDSLQEGE